MEICGEEKVGVKCVFNTKESAIADDPQSHRGGSGAIPHLFCIAAYGALLTYTTCLPLVSPGVIIVSPLRGFDQN